MMYEARFPFNEMTSPVNDCRCHDGITGVVIIPLLSIGCTWSIGISPSIDSIAWQRRWCFCCMVPFATGKISLTGMMTQSLESRLQKTAPTELDEDDAAAINY